MSDFELVSVDSEEGNSPDDGCEGNGSSSKFFHGEAILG
jgi:hypothetical protein